MQNFSNSSALALELLQSYTKPSIHKNNTLYLSVVVLRHLFNHSYKCFRPGAQCHERISHRNSNLIEFSFCNHPGENIVIAMTFCTWYDRCAVVACAKFCSDMIAYHGVKLIFHLIHDRKIIREMGPWLVVSTTPVDGQALMGVCIFAGKVTADVGSRCLCGTGTMLSSK